jgi:hypothetical protein
MIQNELPDFLTPSIGQNAYNFFVDDVLLPKQSPWHQVENWGQLTPLVVRFELDFPIATVLKECGLVDSSSIALGLSATSSRTKIKLVSALAKLDAETTSLELTLPGEFLGGELSLAAFMTIESSVAEADKAEIAPKDWSVIWRANVGCQLEGSFSRADIHPGDFSGTELDKVLWRVDAKFPADADAWILCEINSALSVTYNTKHSDFLHSNEGSQLLKADYARNIIQAAIETEGVLEICLAPSSVGGYRGTLISTAAVLINALFRTSEADLIKSLWGRKRSQFEARIQQLVEVSG